MAESTFTFRVDDDLKASFAEAAKAQDRTGAQMLRDFMRTVVRDQNAAADYDTWFRAEVEQGIREADDPKTVSTSQDDVEAWLEARKAEILKRTGG